MRAFVLGVCVSVAACSGQNLYSATSPTSAVPAAVSPQANAVPMPFSGSFTIATTGALDCPPTCPPTTLQVTGTVEGTATRLGRFTATSLDVVDLATGRSTGTFNFNAANGDQLFTVTAGGQDGFVPPNTSHVTVLATIIGGTGRFAGAGGTVTVEYSLAIDFATGAASGSGSFNGQITLGGS